MNQRTKGVFEEIRKAIERVAVDKTFSREQYREFLEEIASYCEGSIEGLRADGHDD